MGECGNRFNQRSKDIICQNKISFLRRISSICTFPQLINTYSKGIPIFQSECTVYLMDSFLLMDQFQFPLMYLAYFYYSNKAIFQCSSCAFAIVQFVSCQIIRIHARALTFLLSYCDVSSHIKPFYYGPQIVFSLITVCRLFKLHTSHSLCSTAEHKNALNY